SDTVLIGASGHNSNTGAVYVFSRNQGGADNWGQVQELAASDAAQGDGLGRAVGISGDTVLVGAFGRNSSAGAAYVFENQCGQWTQAKETTASDGAQNDLFGYSVGISGDTVVIGAENKNNLVGSVYIFERNQGGAESWGQVKAIPA